jgi:hypothetical protein
MPMKQQTFDSAGPDIRVRGNAYQVWEKYLGLARDAQSAGDRIAAENFFQHAEHYYRIMNANGGDPASYNGRPRYQNQREDGSFDEEQPQQPGGEQPQPQEQRQGDQRPADLRQSEGRQNEGRQNEGRQNEGRQSEGRQNEGRQSEGRQGDGRQGDGRQGEGRPEGRESRPRDLRSRPQSDNQGSQGSHGANGTAGSGSDEPSSGS